uniref:Uncharacterized protein n=1 Tax=Tanacetum cinerariifolium TaxID=118510 RepID=A0A6L2MEE1_TANCI|nr:hypothetical protein [Tanacetum cinerariifolium]
MDTLSLVSEYLKDLEECMYDGDLRVAKEMKLFDDLEHKSVLIEVDGQGAWDAELDLANLVNYVKKKVLDSKGFVHVSISDYGRKMVNDVNVEIHEVKFKVDFVVLDYANEREPSIMFGRDFLATIKSQVDFRLGQIRMNLTMFEEVNGVINILEEVGSSSEEVVKTGKANNNKGIQIGYQAYVVDLLVLDILVDPELPLLLGRPFLRTYGAVIDMGRGTLCIDDEVIRHTYFPKPRSKSYVETFEMEGEDDWLGNFEVRRDEDRNAKYGLVAPSFLDIKDDMEMALKMEAYFNPFKNIIVFEKLVDFLDRSIGVPRVGNWGVFNAYGFEDTLRNMMKLEYIYEGDGDVFVDYSWERALSINDEVYHEWVLEFFSTMYFDKDVDKINLMTEKYTTKMLVEELDEKDQCLLKETGILTQARIGSSEKRQELRDFGGNTSGYAVEGSSRGAGFDVEDMDE